MRVALLLFPREWRRRYGDEFQELFAGDDRRLRKWLDLLRTAAGLRLRQVRSSASTGGMVTVALLIVTAAHAGVGIGMDERLETLGPADLTGRWWGLPVALSLLAAAALVVIAALSFIHHVREAWIALASVAACGVGALGGSLGAAAIRPGQASLGAGAGLLIAAVVVRLLGRRPPSRDDFSLTVGMVLVTFLGWRAAANPLWPVLLLVVAGMLLASASFPAGHGTTRTGELSD